MTDEKIRDSLQDPFRTRKSEIAEQEAWRAVSDALLQYADHPSLAHARAVEQAAREFRALSERAEALENEVAARQARHRKKSTHRYHPVGAAGCLPSRVENGDS